MMTRFLLSLALLCPFVAKAAVPSFQDFYGTNGIIIRTNGVLGNQKVTVDGTNLVPFSKVWGTNGIIVRTNNGIVTIDGNSLVTKTNAMTWGLTNTGTFTNSGDAFFGQNMNIFDSLVVQGALEVWDAATFSNGVKIAGFNATPDYVWTATNANGMGEWRASQGGTGSGGGTNAFGSLSSSGISRSYSGDTTNTMVFQSVDVVSNVTATVLTPPANPYQGFTIIDSGYYWVSMTTRAIATNEVRMVILTNGVADPRSWTDHHAERDLTNNSELRMTSDLISYFGSGWTVGGWFVTSAGAGANANDNKMYIERLDGATGTTGTGSLTVQTNGVTVGTESTLNWTVGVTGYVSGGVLNLGLSGSGSGEANYNGEVSLTNATQFGWVYGKAGVTNLLRSIRPAWGLVGTNESTNIAVAVDPAVIASQADLVSASNTIVNLAQTNGFNSNQFATNSGIISIKSGPVITNLNAWNVVNFEGHDLFEVGTADTIIQAIGFTNIWFAPEHLAGIGHGARLTDNQFYPQDDDFFDLGNSGQHFRTAWILNIDVLNVTNRGVLLFSHAAAAGTTTLVADGSLTLRTNYITGNTTMLVSNLSNGQIFTWVLQSVGGGWAMTFPQVNITNSNVREIPQLGTNEQMKVVVTRTGTLTNFNFYPMELILAAASPLALSTNDATGIVTITNNGGRIVETVTGVGGANTNFTFIAGDKTIYVDAGTTNVNVLAIMGYSATTEYTLNIIATNRTATARGFSLGAITNNWIPLQQIEGTTAPYVVTNSRSLFLSCQILGSNVFYAAKHAPLPTN